MTTDDRVAFSLKIVNADSEIRGLDFAKKSLLAQQVPIQSLDTANKHLFDPVNALVNAYQSELAVLDGIVRSTVAEQDIQDAAAKKIQNDFFPNDLSATVPSITSLRNVWPRVQPYALTFAIGKNYVEVYPGTATKEADVIASVTSLISSASANLDIENTSGEHVVSGPSAIVTFPAAVTLKVNLVVAVNALVTFLNSELALIPADSPNQAQNDAARNDINAVILPALSAWLAQPDFNPVPGSVTPATFPTYDAALLAPTKLYSGQLAILQTALNTRLSYVTTRSAQVSSVLGNITQDINTGIVTAQSGLYGKRYGFLSLRLNALGGSLIQLVGLQTASGAQDSIKENTISTKAIYMSLVPTTKLKSNASNSSVIHLVDTSFLSVGDTVYIYAEGQQELLRGVKSIQGDMVTLNDIVPLKYTTLTNARLYKDLT